jgi:hypothetical protein
MLKPRTKDEYLDLLDQAIFETNDLLTAAEDDEEIDDFGAYLPIYEQLSKELQKLHDDVRDGRHQFANGADLPFMPVARKWKHKIPLFVLLDALNTAHRSGL